jgi:hypothetical protein
MAGVHGSTNTRLVRKGQVGGNLARIRRSRAFGAGPCTVVEPLIVLVDVEIRHGAVCAQLRGAQSISIHAVAQQAVGGVEARVGHAHLLASAMPRG